MSPLRRSTLLVLALTGMLSTVVPMAQAAQRATIVPFTPLDRDGAVIPNILVTALDSAPDGTLYAGGRYMVRDADPYASPPAYPTGSVWLVSRDHGATWTQHVSTTDAKAFSRTGASAWTNHQALPIDFTPLGIAVDQRNPRLIYMAGCSDLTATCAQPLPNGHLVVRSSDGGRTWQDLLADASIVRTPALQRALLGGPSRIGLPTVAYAIAADPRSDRHLYAAVDGLGVLRSDITGRHWIYVTQPQTGQVTRPCELLLDVQHPNTVYELNRAGAIYRTTDGGASWTMRAPLSVLVGGSVTSLTIVGRTLYVTAARGLYASTDAGAHWTLQAAAPANSDLYQSVRGANGWVSAFASRTSGSTAGLYARRDGQTWQTVANTDRRGPQGYGSLDFQAMDADLGTRLWEDHTARIVFTAGPLGGLYRWQSSI